MLDLDLELLAYAKNDFEVKSPLFVTENELKSHHFDILSSTNLGGQLYQICFVKISIP